jgi:sugar phosphate isomerase/epimerase
MLLGLSSLHLRGLDFLPAARAAAEEGFRWMEIWLEQLRGLPLAGAALARELRALGLGWSLHADMRDLNIASRNRGIRAESLRQAIDAVRAAAAIEAPFVTIHPGKLSSSKDPPDVYLDEHADSISRICAAAGSLGLKVALENMEPQRLALATTWAGLKALADKVSSPYLGLTIDIAHMYGLPASEADLLLESAEPVINAHVSDASATPAHLILGAGDYDFGARTRKLARRYSGPIVIEGSDPKLGLSVLPRIAAELTKALASTD